MKGRRVLGKEKVLIRIHDVETFPATLYSSLVQYNLEIPLFNLKEIPTERYIRSEKARILIVVAWRD